MNSQIFLKFCTVAVLTSIISYTKNHVCSVCRTDFFWPSHMCDTGHMSPRWKNFFVWPELRITPIFTTHFCQILPEPWEILRIYAPSGCIHGTDPCVTLTGHVINWLLFNFSSQLTFFSHIFQNFLWWPFFAHTLIFYPPPSINFSPHSGFFYPPNIFCHPPRNFPPCVTTFCFHSKNVPNILLYRKLWRYANAIVNIALKLDYLYYYTYSIYCTCKSLC